MEYIVEKIGMSRTINTKSLPVTLLRVIEAKVCEISEKQAIVAYSNGKKHNKSIAGKQAKHNLSKEFNKFVTLNVKDAQIGDLDTAPLVNAKELKVSFNSKGRGFTGVVKRWNFSGGPTSHGSRFHRTTGSIGNCEFPGRVQKGRKMPGHYGNTKVTVKNDVVSFDVASGVLVVRGSVPGANGSLGRVRIVK